MYEGQNKDLTVSPILITHNKTALEINSTETQWNVQPQDKNVITDKYTNGFIFKHTTNTYTRHTCNNYWGLQKQYRTPDNKELRD